MTLAAMCGIAGIVHGDRERPVDRAILQRMSDTLAHRGPDDCGLWQAPGVGLAHRRLSIIDLSEAGRQPMSNEDGSVWTVFNGEIYNFRELRAELLERGHAFRSNTDAEVIVHLYEEVGDRFVERLYGMFAIAVWDTRRRRLVLARDRLGKKPLKYAHVGGDLLFASELKALRASGLVSSEIDTRAIHQFMTRGYVPAPLTGFHSIKKLPPAHTLVWENGTIRLHRYWHLSFIRKQERTEDEWKAEVRATVRKAVARRLVSDVPLGAFLSGGIDSTIVVACMAELMDRAVDTFSIGFEHEVYNELPYAKAVAERYGTNHHEFVVRADAAALLDRLATLYEEPYADSSALPSYVLARETRRHVTVALNGDGGDEGFAGYTRYAQLERWTARLAWLRRTGVRSLTRLPVSVNGELPSRFVRRFDKIYHITDPDLGARYGWTVRLFSDREKAAMYGDDLRQYLGEPSSEALSELMRRREAGSSSLDQMLFADTMSYLPDDLLVKIDLATMAHGLEARSPLLDHEVLELAASVPAELKYRSGTLKWLLKEAFRDRIPAELIGRSKKGFSIPLDQWFRESLCGVVHELLLSESTCIRDFLRPEAIRSLVHQHESREVDHGHRLWGLVMLELWQRNVVREASPQ